jgi:hypothetical protein
MPPTRKNEMIVLAILATIASIIWTGFVVVANGMSDAPQMAFQGGWMIAAAWVVVAALYLAWWVG